MRAFAQKRNQPQQAASSSLARPNKAISQSNYHIPPLLDLQHTISNQTAEGILQANAEPFKSITIQPKLAVNPPGDIHEQEADDVSEQVMRMPQPQRGHACPCGGTCPRCEAKMSHPGAIDAGCPSEEHQHWQTKHTHPSHSGKTAVPPIVHDALASPGHPLDTTTRRFMEPRFGHDFSRVRVHTDSKAAESARNIGALAYTVGHNIVFARGQYTPTGVPGKKLLVHELAHVIQQGRSGRAVQRTPDKIEIFDAREAGALKPNQRQAAKSCDIKCDTDIVGTLHAMPLSSAIWNKDPLKSPPSPGVQDEKADSLVAALHVVKGGKSDSKGGSGCACSGFKIIQVVTRQGGSSVDVNRDNLAKYIRERDKANKYIKSIGDYPDIPFRPPYYDVWAENRKGRKEHEIPKGYPDAGKTVNADHSIYDRPRLEPTTSTQVWNAEACVVCQRDGERDKILGGITYGFSRVADQPMVFDPLECHDKPSSRFLNKLKARSVWEDYDFVGRVTKGAPDLDLH